MLQDFFKIFQSISKTFYTGLLIVGILLLIGKAFVYTMKADTITLPSSTEVKNQQIAKFEALLQNPEYNTPENQPLLELVRGSMCSFIGELCHKNKVATLQENYNSILGRAVMAIGYPLLNPPSSGIAYTKLALSNIGFVPRSYAAEGIGFASIKNYISVWKAMRDVVFLLLVMILIIIGFMIMFRFKINPQTVASIENALPKFILTMLYISFSFAIAGFLIDAMYLVIFFIFEVASNLIPHAPIAEIQNQYLFGNILNLTPIIGMREMNVHVKALVGLFDLLPTMFQILIGFLGIWIQTILIRRLADSVGRQWINRLGDCGIDFGVKIGVCSLLLNVIVFLWAGKMIPIILWIAVGAIVAIGFIFLITRILFMVIGAYVQILLSVLLAPLFILTEAIPGKQGFFPWVKRLVGYLLVFPTLISLLLILRFINTVGLVGSTPLGLPLLFNFNSDALVAIISGVFLFMIPDLTKGVVKKIAGDTQLKGSVGMLFGGTTAAAKTGFGAYTGIASQARYIPWLKDFANKRLGMKIQ